MDLLFCLRGHNFPITAISLGDQLVSGDDSGSVFIWNLDLRRVNFHFKVSSAPILHLKQSAETIIVQSRDNMIRIFDFKGTILDEIPCESLHFCKFAIRDNRLVFCNPYKPGIIIYDITSKSVINNLPFVENLGACTALVYDLSTESIFVGYEDGSCVLTSIKDGSTAISPRKHSEPIMGLDTNRDGCISCGADDGVIFHGFNDSVKDIKLDNPGASCVKFCGTKVLVCGWNAKLYLYDNFKLSSCKMEHRRQCRCADYEALKIKGKEVGIAAVGSEDNLISVWKIL